MTGSPVSILLDATVLSNFAASDSVDFLQSTFERPAAVDAVSNEISRGVDGGNRFLEPAATALESDAIEVVSEPTNQNTTHHDEIHRRLDRGEARTLLVAIEMKPTPTVATDDSQARSVANDLDLSVTGSIGVLVRGVLADDLSLETADDWLDCWIEEREYYAPVDSVSEALPDGPR